MLRLPSLSVLKINDCETIRLKFHHSSENYTIWIAVLLVGLVTLVIGISATMKHYRNERIHTDNLITFTPGHYFIQTECLVLILGLEKTRFGIQGKTLDGIFN